MLHLRLQPFSFTADADGRTNRKNAGQDFSAFLAALNLGGKKVTPLYHKAQQLGFAHEFHRKAERRKEVAKKILYLFASLSVMASSRRTFRAESEYSKVVQPFPFGSDLAAV